MDLTKFFQACATCRDQPAVGITPSWSSSVILPSSSCWIYCVGRVLFLFCGAVLLLQLRLLLPGFFREACATIVFGAACVMAVSAGLVPKYWYMLTCLQMLGYFGSHWLYFATKEKLQAAFSGKNPTSSAVNQSLHGLETLRRCYAMAPIFFVAAHAIRLVWSNTVYGYHWQ